MKICDVKGKFLLEIPGADLAGADLAGADTKFCTINFSSREYPQAAQFIEGLKDVEN